MKLYTKEMFLQAAEKCEVSMIDAEHIMLYIDEYVTPIELPSDEEIEIESNKEYQEQSYVTKMAKKCAMVAVDEIMYNCYEVMKPFWQEVKIEIENL